MGSFMSKNEGRVVIWPAYIDAERSRGDGRQISKRDAIEKPTVDEIMVAAMEMGLAPEAVWPLDALRKQRHLADYSGDAVPESAAAACLQSAQMLQAHVLRWLREQHPELLPAADGEARS